MCNCSSYAVTGNLRQTHFRLLGHWAFYCLLMCHLIYFSGTTANREHFLCIFSSWELFVLMCLLLPETAPIVSVGKCMGIKGNWVPERGGFTFPIKSLHPYYFVCDLYTLFKVHVSRMAGSFLLKEIRINNTYSIMKIT